MSSTLTTEESDFASEHHGIFKRDGVWYRLKGWGSADDWDVFPLVIVPDDHAEAIVAFFGGEVDRMRGDMDTMADGYQLARRKLSEARERASNAEARLHNWRSPDERPEDGERILVYRKRPDGSDCVFDGGLFSAGQPDGADHFCITNGGWWVEWIDINAWRPLSEVVAEIPEALR